MPRKLNAPKKFSAVENVFDPYSAQGMLDAFAFFAMEHDTHVSPRGTKVWALFMRSITITMTPTDDETAIEHVTAEESSGEGATLLAINTPTKVEYKEDGELKFYAKQPAAVLSIYLDDDVIEATLKATDIKHPDKTHCSSISKYRHLIR